MPFRGRLRTGHPEDAPKSLDPYEKSEPRKCRPPSCPATWHVGLKGYWQFENTTADTIGSDVGGGTQTDGVLKGDANYTNLIEGKLGRALKLDGSGDYMKVPDDTTFYQTLDPERALTVSTYVRSDDPTGAWDGVVVKQPGSYAVHVGYERVRFAVTTNVSSTNVQSSAGSIKADTWHHITATYNKSAGEMKLYVDGSQVASTTLTGAVDNTTGELSVGYDNSEYFDGEIDQVRLYHRDLNQSEIQGFSNHRCLNRQRSIECLRNPELCDTDYTGTRNYHCNYGKFDDPQEDGYPKANQSQQGTGICCPRNQDAEWNDFRNEWECTSTDECGLGSTFECRYNISASEKQYLNDTWQGSGDLDWCQSQVPRIEDNPDQPAPSKSSACCYVPKQGELNWWFKDGNVRIYG